MFYVNVPILIGFHTTNSLTIQVGPELGYLIIPLSSNDIKRLDFLYNKFDFGLVIGAKYFLTSNIGFGFRYNHGISPLLNTEFRDSSGYISKIVKVQNRSFQLSANYVIK